MAPHSIIIDQYRLLPPREGTVTVTAISDYVPACLALRTALHDPASAPLDIRVYEATVAAWLAALADRYGEHRVRVQRYTARQALSERWNISIPEHISDRDISHSRLLDEQVTAREGQSFDDALLEHFYSDVLAYPRFPIEHLATLLNTYDPDTWRANERRPLVLRTYRSRLEQWRRKEKSEACRLLIERLITDPLELRTRFASYKVLRQYPQTLMDKVLGEDAGLFKRARADSDTLSLRHLDIKAAEIAIAYYLEEAKKHITSGDDVIALLDLMSGHLLIEFTTIEAIMRQHADWMTADLLRRIEQRFRPIHAGIGSRLASMRQLIAPVRPQEPCVSWSADEWLSWVRDAYMPYYRWLDARRHTDEAIAGYATIFADWYYAHFIDLKHGTPEQFAFNALYQERDRLRSDGTIGLIVLVDNFNYLHFTELRRLFHQHDFVLQDDRPVFSLIPTATEISKAGVLGGFGDQTDIPNPRYADLIAKEWGQNILSPVHKTATYLANLGELQNLSERIHDVYFLNYLPIDSALHDNAQETGQTHTTVVHGHLQHLTTAIVEFARRFQIERHLIVYILSDHGATRIHADVINVLDHTFYKGIAMDKHHRYIPVSEQKRAELPQMVEQQCYILDKHRFKTNEHYLVARGYYRFLKTTEDFYVHGGLTPEEVVVPFARFEVKPISITPPTLHLVTTQFRYTIRSVVDIEVGNPNNYPLEQIRVTIPGLDSEEQSIDILAPRQTRSVKLPALFKKEPGAGNTRELAVRVRYECQGRAYDPLNETFTITMKSMMEAKRDFDL